MKYLILVSILGLSAPVFSKCEDEASAVAHAAVELFKVNDNQSHCNAAGFLTSLKSLPVIAVMPARYSYEAEFDFPCGPQPRNPVVKMLLNSNCQIANLEVSGFEL